MTEMPSLPKAKKMITSMRLEKVPKAFNLPRAAGMIAEFSKNASFNPAKSKPCLLIYSSRFGSSQTMPTRIMYYIYSFQATGYRKPPGLLPAVSNSAEAGR
jgi:hypothetical protein